MPEYLFRDQPPDRLNVSGSKGSYVLANGKKYLDFGMGWCVGNSGWGNAAIEGSFRKFRGPVYVTPTAEYEGWERLSSQLVSLMPDKGMTCFRSTGGTEAVEVALKASRAFNRRKKFMAFQNAYHGQSLACLGLVGIHEDKFGPYPDDYVRLPSDWKKALEMAISKIRKREICAFISEPIIANQGVRVPPEGFLKEIREECERTDTVFIMDEVATGFGRTGKWFGFEHFGLEPDIVTVGKGFSSGYAPIGATIAREGIAEKMKFPFSVYSTFGWHPLSVEASIANIKYIRKKGLVENSRRMGEYLAGKLAEFRPEGKGLCVGFDQKNSDFEKDCLEQGMIVYSFNTKVVLFPSLEVSKKEIDRAVEIIKECA